MNQSPFPSITSAEIKEYCISHSSGQSPSLEVLDKLTQSTSDPIMMSGPYLGRLLNLISLIKRPKNILEIGTFTGYGTLCLAEGLQENGKVITIEKNPQMKSYTDQAFENSTNIIQKFGDALEIIPELPYNFDLVFIDAAKRQYTKYFELVFPKLNPGGIVLADNVLWKGKVASDNNDRLGEGLDAFNKFIRNHEGVSNIIIPIDDGLNMIIKK